MVYPVRMPHTLYERIKRAAHLDGRSAANYMRRVLDLATREQLAAIDHDHDGGQLERAP